MIGSTEPTSRGCDPVLKYSPTRVSAESVGVSLPRGKVIPNNFAYQLVFWPTASSNCATLTNDGGISDGEARVGTLSTSVSKPTRYLLSISLNEIEVTVFTALMRVR